MAGLSGLRLSPEGQPLLDEPLKNFPWLVGLAKYSISSGDFFHQQTTGRRAPSRALGSRRRSILLDQSAQSTGHFARATARQTKIADGKTPLNNREPLRPDLHDFHDFVAVVVDDFYGDAAGSWDGEGAAGGAVQR